MFVSAYACPNSVLNSCGCGFNQTKLVPSRVMHVAVLLETNMLNILWARVSFSRLIVCIAFEDAQNKILFESIDRFQYHHWVTDYECERIREGKGA